MGECFEGLFFHAGAVDFSHATVLGLLGVAVSGPAVYGDLVISSCEAGADFFGGGFESSV